jgi:AbrB family looped-hinge helix DNA binding protein
MHTWSEAEAKIIQRVGKRRAVVIPRDLCAVVGLEEGDFIELKAVDGTVVIKPKKLVDPGELPQAHATVHHT